MEELSEQEKNQKVKEIIENYYPISEKEKTDKKSFLELVNHYNNFLYRDSLIGHITAAGYVINEDFNQALVIKHNILGEYLFPGGHADGECDLLKVAIKEVEEETGLCVTAYQKEPIAINIGPVPRHIKKGKIVAPHLHFDIIYLLIAKNEDMSKIRILESENNDIKWCSLEDTYSEKMLSFVRETTKEIVSKINQIKENKEV